MMQSPRAMAWSRAGSYASGRRPPEGALPSSSALAPKAAASATLATIGQSGRGVAGMTSPARLPAWVLSTMQTTGLAENLRTP